VPARYRISPGPGRGHRPGHGACTSGGCGTAPGPGGEASGRRPGRRLMPAAQPARSPGTLPGDDGLDAVAAHRARAAADSPCRPPGNSQREAPWPPGTGGPRHASARERQGLAAGPAAPRAQTPDVAGPLRRRCPGLPAVRRLSGPGRQVVPSRHHRRGRFPGVHSCMVSGLDIPRSLWRALARRGTEGN
jgi:hypothetical protein